MHVSPPTDGYSKVIIYCGQNEDGEDIIYEAGDDTGRALEIKNDFGTPEMAADILAKIRGWQYQPLEATDALLDPAAELGDGVTVNGEYSGIFVKKTKYEPQILSDISAPMSEEIEHEFVVESPTDRAYTRMMSTIRASLSINASAIRAEVAARTEADEQMSSELAVQATQISAKVSKTGGDASSFGWTLTDSSWSVSAGSKEVFRIDADGAHVTGIVTATSGTVGGFHIGQSAIWNGISEFGGTQNSGVYIGTNGIQLGQGFKVNPSGQATFAGNVTINGTQFSAATFGKGVSGGSRWGGSGSSSSSRFSCDASYVSVKDVTATTMACTGTAYLNAIETSSLFCTGFEIRIKNLGDISVKGATVVTDKAGNDRTVLYLS